MKFFLFVVIFTFALYTEGRVYTPIDAFDDVPSQPPLVLIVTRGGETVNYVWYSPYYVNGGDGGPPAAIFFSTTQALGGQRDGILGYETISPANSVSVLSIVGNAASVAFPLNYAGGAYFQWDGDDAAGSVNTQAPAFDAAFPGAALSLSPGIGNGEAISGNDQSIDFRFGARAVALTITVEADHLVNYFLDVLSSAGDDNTLGFTVDPQSEDQTFSFFFRFTDQTWSNANFDWSDVAAFQVRILTFSDQGGGTEQAIDTEFRFLNIFGFEVSGTVVIDCLCDAVPDSNVNNEQVNLFLRGGVTPIETTTTDVNGFYEFVGLDTGLYTVCLDNQVQSVCGNQANNCLDFELSQTQQLDVVDLDFFLEQTSSLVVPPDVDLDCGACTTPECVGFATAEGCGGGSVQITTWTETDTTVNCVRTIRRTWVDPDSNQSGVQTITTTDSDAPLLTVPASDVTQFCDDPSTYATWISTNAGAQATDCSSFSFVASQNFEPFFCDFETVTFTATDVCGLSVSTTATYTVLDNLAPTFTVESSDSSAECNLKTGSSQNALNSWVASIGGATFSDNCASSGQLSVANDFVGFPSSCLGSETVTWSVTDNCGNVALTTSTFTISDTTAPTITVEASDFNTPCSSGGGDTGFQNWLDTRGGAQATDACIANDVNLTWSNNFGGGGIGGPGTCNDGDSVTFTVLDNCGFSASTVASYSIVDNTLPVFTVRPSSLAVQCDGTGNLADFNAWIADNAGARASDSCTDVTFSNSGAVAPQNCGDVATVTFSIIDDCGNGPVSDTANFSIVDNVAPFFVVDPQDDNVECSTSSSSQFDAWLASNAGASIADDCNSSGLTITNDRNGQTLNPGCLNSARVTFFANDPCNNVSPGVSATFTISDNISPVITSPAADVSFECDASTNQADYQSFLSTRGGAEATDSCGNVAWSNNGVAVAAVGCDELTSVTFTANDGCGNTAVTTGSFRVVDSNGPTLISEANDVSVECNGNGNTNDLNNWLTSRGGASAVDTCTGVTWTNDFTALSGGCVSSAVVTYTGCDECGRCVFTTATFTVSDNSAPTINPPASSQTVECDPSGNQNAFTLYLDDNGGARASDICNPNSLVWTNTFNASPFGCESEEITFTVTDLCGRSDVTTAIFTILDSVSPTFVDLPEDISVECDGNGNLNDYTAWVSSRAGATATDVCALQLFFVDNAPQAGPVGCGSQVVSFTVEDECNNAVSRSATFTVVDTQSPFVSGAADLTVECDTSTNQSTLQDWLNNNAGAVATDSCYGNNLSFSNNFVALSSDVCNQFAEVTFTATDPCGQSGSATATFTIVDSTNPVITTVAADALFECNAATNDGEVANYVSTRGGAVATDSCTLVTWSNDFVSAPNECEGPMSIVFTATDLCGNFATTVGSVAIDDTIPPTFTNFPADRVVECDSSPDPSQTGSPVPVDQCSSQLEASFSDFVTQEPNERFCIGDSIITRTWTVFDDCGNIFTQDQTITSRIPFGTCEFTPCPPCDGQVCCPSSLEPVPCNPVGCNPVPCSSTECDSVPCLPVVCEGSVSVPIYTDDDDTIPIRPSPAASPLVCEPVYIYVFDDDEYDDQPIYVNESTSSASILTFSALIGLLMVLLF